MSPRRLFAALLCSVLIGSIAAPIAAAGTLLERLQQRRAEARGEQGVGPEEAAAGDKAPSKFTLPPGVRVERDLAYGSDPAQRLDVYLPATATPASADKMPIVLMVHGGGWMLGDKGASGVVANKLAHWLPKGYLFVSTNYRMKRPPDPLEQAQDVGRALAYVQLHAADWGGDPRRTVLMGHSSGAHLVALLAADPALATAQGAQPWLGTVAIDSAALDVVKVMEAKHYRFYDQVFGSDRQRWRDASPQDRLQRAQQPMLLVCSSERQDSCPAAQAFADKAGRLGGRASVLPVALKHGAINSQLGVDKNYTGQVDDFLRSLGLP